jgi:hypothetical protein
MKKYKVIRGIQRDDKYRFEPGDVIQAKDIRGAPIKAWLESGVLEEVMKNGDG